MPLRKAVANAPDMPMIAVMLGHALIASEKPEYFAEAKQVLKNAVNRDNDNPFAWYQLGIVYDREGDQPRAALATSETSLAVALSVCALFSITLGTLWQKRHGAGVDVRTGAAIQFMAASVVLAPFALLEGGSVRWSGEFVFALGWLALVLSLGAIFLLLTLIKRGRATQVSSLFYLVPPTTALIAWPLFGETYSLAAAAGMGLAMLAVWLVMKA